MVDGIIDTSILIDILRKNQQALNWQQTVASLRLAITPTVWMETVQGATDKQKREQILRFLRQFTLEYATQQDQQWAMRQTARLSLGYGIHTNDVMIASIAIRLSIPIYTLNIKHFQPLPSIQAILPY